MYCMTKWTSTMIKIEQWQNNNRKYRQRIIEYSKVTVELVNNVRYNLTKLYKQ